MVVSALIAQEDTSKRMNAIVLAAGRGTRLGELGRRVPKALIPIGDRPLLAHHLASLERAGVRRVVVNAFHLSSQIEEFTRAYQGPLDLVCSVEPGLFGTAGSVQRALPLLEPGPFLVVYGDVFVADSLAPLIAVHARGRASATLAVHPEQFAEGKGVVEVDPAGRVTAFVEKGHRGCGRFLINSGIYVLEPGLLSILPERSSVPLDFGHDVLPAALRAGKTILTHRLVRPVIDIGTEEGLARARSLAS
jgi:mannose-1-phosphate guanylyltransferase